MVTVKFGSEGGTKDVKYKMNCDKTLDFLVSEGATLWLSFTKDLGNNKIAVTVPSSETERTGYIIPKIGDNEPCKEKKLEVKQLMN